MSDPFAHGAFPRLPLIAAGLMVAASLTAVTAVRLSGGPPTLVPLSDTVVSRTLRFEDQPGGNVAVIDAGTGAVIETLTTGNDGFVRATLRSLARERRSNQGGGAEVPFVLTAHVDHRLTLRDTATGRSIDLEAFGPTNARAFARFLPAASER